MKNFRIIGAIAALALILTIATEAQTIAPHGAEYERALRKLKILSAEASNSDWNYRHESDELTQKQIWSASVQSENTVSLSFPYEGEQNATLELRHHPQFGKDVILSVERGQILCSPIDGCSVMVRFDNKNAKNFSAAPPADNSSNMIFIRNYGRFVLEAASAKTVVVQVTFFQNGEQAFKFKIAGLKGE